jgi:hypothetical protein
MQSAKKRVVALSALSMAAVATLGTTKSAKGVTFNFYYDNVNILSAQDQSGTYQGALVTNVTPSLAAAATFNTAPTVTLQVGQILEFGMDASVTGDTALSVGNQQSSSAGKIPAAIGASELGMQFNSSDATGARLAPLNNGTGTGNNTSTASLNNSPSSAVATGGQTQGSLNDTGSGQGNNTGGAFIPNWNSEIQTGDIETNSGSVGANQTISGGTKAPNTTGVQSATAGEIQELGQFGATATGVANATDFFDSLQFQAVGGAGTTVTLSPFSFTGQDEYWSQTNTSTAASASRWKVESFGTNADVVAAIPQLVVVIAGTTTTSSASPLFSLTTAAPGAAYGSQILNGSGANNGTFTGTGAAQNTLTVVGGSGVYAGAQVTGISGGAGTNQGYVAANGFSPATDKEIFALDVEVNGTQASTSQLNTLIADAGTIGGGLPAGVTVTTVAPAPNPFSSFFDVFVDVNPGIGAAPFLGMDLLSTNDSNLAGYTVSAVAVVPEPMSLGLLALGGVGLMARRNRRKA